MVGTVESQFPRPIIDTTYSLVKRLVVELSHHMSVKLFRPPPPPIPAFESLPKKMCSGDVDGLEVIWAMCVKQCECEVLEKKLEGFRGGGGTG